MKDIIIKPVISEKSFNQASENVYTFSVPMRANKIEISHQVKELFKVDVEDVRTVVVKGKKKRVRGVVGKRKDKKKAFVLVKKGQKIKIFETEETDKKSKKKDK
jgi:large subunit ribosomal protein L23